MFGMEHTIKNLDEMAIFAETFVSSLTPSESFATVVGLSGDLGSGKTAFTKMAAKALGVKDEVLSPTFVIAKFYPLDGKHWNELIHIDAYRIEDEHELTPLRLDEMLNNRKKLICIEWPEQLGRRYPEFASTLRFMFIDEQTRKVTISS